MLEAIARSLPMSLGIALSPIPIAAILIMLLSKRAVLTAPAFLAGWVAGILGIGVFVLAVPGIETARGEPTMLSGILHVVFGVLMLLVALIQWRRRPAPDAAPQTPKLLGRLDAFGFPGALLAGLVFSVVNPKNLVLVAAGAAAIDDALSETGPTVPSLLVFTAIASLTIAGPVVAHIVARRRSEALFAAWKEWLIRNNATVMTVLMIVFGPFLIARGLQVLTAP